MAQTVNHEREEDLYQVVRCLRCGYEAMVVYVIVTGQRRQWEHYAWCHICRRYLETRLLAYFEEITDASWPTEPTAGDCDLSPLPEHDCGRA